MPDAFDHCETLVRAADKDRFLATLFASERHRRPLFALYAFNSEIARVREIAREPMPGEVRLQWWRDVLTGLGGGEGSPVAAALHSTIERYRLPVHALADLIEARSFDLYDDPMGSLVELEAYAGKTSSAVMALAARILNDGREPGVDALARHAGIASAIMGLLDAFPVHARRRQLYVPLDLLQRHGARAEDAFAGVATPALRAALAELRAAALRHLSQGAAHIPGLQPAVVPAVLPLALVRPTLRRMEHRGHDPFVPRPLPQWRRQWTLWRAARNVRRIVD
jgi:phytoene synthase